MDIINTAIQFLQPIIAFLETKYGTVGMVIGVLVLFVGPLVSVLIEVLEAVVQLTSSTKDDAFVAKVKAMWGKVLPILELIPHVNLPLAPIFVKILQVAGKVLAVVKGIISGILGGGKSSS